MTYSSGVAIGSRATLQNGTNYLDVASKWLRLAKEQGGIKHIFCGFGNSGKDSNSHSDIKNWKNSTQNECLRNIWKIKRGVQLAANGRQ